MKSEVSKRAGYYKNQTGRSPSQFAFPFVTLLTNDVSML